MTRLSPLVLLVLLTSGAAACDQGPFANERHVESAEILAIGRVIGEEAAEPELAGVSDRTVVIEPLETLLGTTSGPFRAPVLCFSSFPAMGERVVFGVDRHKNAWVYPADYAEKQARRAAGSVHQLCVQADC